MKRLVTILTLSVVIGLLAAPSAFAKPLQPPLPPDARSAPAARNAEPSDASAIGALSGLGALVVGVAVYPLIRRRYMPAPC
jgi:hypothetical protein